MKTKISYTFILFLSALLVFNSCSSNQVKNQGMPSVIGAAGELLVVMDKAKWESPIGDTLRHILAAQIPSIAQEESYFDLTQVQDNNFNGVFKNHRNILIVDIKPSSKLSFTIKEDVWASPQLVGYLVAPSADSLISLIAREGELVRNKFEFKEIDRLIKINQQTPNRHIVDELKAKHNYWLSLPRGYTLDVSKNNFFWISSGSPEVTLGVIGWDYPYTSKDQLSVENLIKKRNEMLQLNVPGPTEKSYMKTEDLFTPITNELVYKGLYFKQVYGLWKLENAFMGGSFVNFTTVDDDRKRIITVEGFVYAPRKEKRNYLRQLEGILYTLEVVKDKK
jgi:hypothetical protein